MQRRQLEIEEARERDRVSESRKARLVARIVSDRPRGVPKPLTLTSYHLYVENLGPAEARDVDVILDGKAYREHPVAVTNHQDIHRLGPKPSHFRYSMSIASEKAPPFDLELRWTDDSGEPGLSRTTLTF